MGYEPLVIPNQFELVNDDFIKNNVDLFDTISFIGFPGKNNTYWHDEEANLPILRTGVIASYTHKPFVNKSIITDDVLLVSGFSFSGSSGSPVFLHHGSGSGIRAIIGIMSGHWWEKDKTPEMFMHSGLSYFTTSGSILALINKHV